MTSDGRSVGTEPHPLRAFHTSNRLNLPNRCHAAGQDPALVITISESE
jgi:hypothetical protein